MPCLINKNMKQWEKYICIVAISMCVHKRGSVLNLVGFLGRVLTAFGAKLNLPLWAIESV